MIAASSPAAHAAVSETDEKATDALTCLVGEHLVGWARRRGEDELAQVTPNDCTRLAASDHLDVALVRREAAAG
eukprot:1126364-Prymnesium_polylepis.1